MHPHWSIEVLRGKVLLSCGMGWVLSTQPCGTCRVTCVLLYMQFFICLVTGFHFLLFWGGWQNLTNPSEKTVSKDEENSKVKAIPTGWDQNVGGMVPTYPRWKVMLQCCRKKREGHACMHAGLYLWIQEWSTKEEKLRHRDNRTAKKEGKLQDDLASTSLK